MTIDRLGRLAAMVYTLLVVELLFLLTTLPALAPAALLDRDASNIPLAGVCAIPLGPALSAAISAMHHRGEDPADLTPAAAFWRGYRLNLRAVLKLWLPALAWLTVIAVSLAHFPAAGVPRWWGALLVVVAVGLTLAAANALVITSLFAFRARDVARLALHFLPSRVSLGNAALLVVAAGVTLISSELVLALLGSVLTAALVGNCRPMVAAIRVQFTA